MKRILTLLLLSISPCWAGTSYCQRPVANLYSHPIEQCEVESQLVYGAPVELLKERRDGWAQVRVADGYEGWVAPGTLFHPPQFSTLPELRMGRVQNLFCHVYRVRDTTPYPPLMTLPYGVSLEIVSEPAEQKHRWIEVRLIDGTVGWVHRGDLDTQPEQLSLDEMLELSHRFLGLPYTWGGTSSFGFDCSGLVQLLYGLMGIEMPRNSRAQAVMPGMTPVALEELVAGDLIFFGNASGRIVHVAIYLGDLLFIHANASAGNPIVLISDVRDPRWKELYPVWIPSKLKHASQH